MDKSKFQFELVDKLAPDIVIKNALKQIAEATNGYVEGNIQEYSGHIHSYTKPGLASSISLMQEPKEIDVQDSLGEQSDVDNRFEVYLSAKGLSKYKYSLMFVDYKAISYPVTIVLNEQLARVYSNKYEDTFIINSMNQLDKLLDKVINSEVLIRIIQSLINEAIRRENSAEETAEQEETSE